MKKDRKYREDYVLDGSGKYKYSGVYYRFDMPVEELGRMKRIYAALALLTAILFVTAGLLNNAGSRIIYVALPYAVMMLPIGFMLWDAVQIVMLKGDMTQKQYDRSVVQLKNVTVATIGLSIIASVGDIVYMATSVGSEQLGREILFMILVMLIGILNMIFISMQNKFICRKIA